MLSNLRVPRAEPALSAWFQDAASSWKDAVLPAYGGGSIANLPASILAGFNAPPRYLGDLLPPVASDILPLDLIAGARVTLLIVIDGLGIHDLTRASECGDVPGLDSAAYQSLLTSVFPPTTAAATTSLQYGVGPGTHGMAGYTIFLPEIGKVFNMITWQPAGREGDAVKGPAPESFLPGENLFSRLEKAGIDTVIVSNAAFKTSPLTRAQATGIRYRGYRTLAEFSYRLLREVKRPGRRFVFGYWDGYDALGHSWGTDNEVAALELRLIDRALREGFFEPVSTLGEDVAVIATADHGHTAMPRNRRLDLGDVDGLIDSLARRPTGEPRQLGLTFKRGQQPDPQTIVQAWPDDAVALSTADAIAAGLYGPRPHHADLASRVSDILLLSRGQGAFDFPDGISGSVGGHGSLTAREMLVPLRVWRYPAA